MMLRKLLDGCISVKTIVEEFGVESPLIWLLSMKFLSAATCAAGLGRQLDRLRTRRSSDFMPAMLSAQ